MTTVRELAQADSATTSARDQVHRRNRLQLTIVLVVVLWIFLYNLLIKGQSPLTAFFQILDTISDDFVMGTLVTVGVGLGIVAVFSVTKLYTQIIANVYSFRILEQLVHGDLKAGRYRLFFLKLLKLEEQPLPDRACPQRVSSLLLSISLLYIMSWVYVVLFSEALFFVSWSSGVDLPVDDVEKMLFMPTLALAIPFSARVMAYLRYPYAQGYADFMPAAVFALLVVTALGQIFESHDQQFFLLRVWSNSTYLTSFLKNGAYLAFVPVFFEAAYWMLELSRAEQPEGIAAGDADKISEHLPSGQVTPSVRVLPSDGGEIGTGER